MRRVWLAVRAEQMWATNAVPREQDGPTVTAEVHLA